MNKRLYPWLHITVWFILLTSDVYNMYMHMTPYESKSLASSGLPAILYCFIFTLGYLLVPLTAFYGFYCLVGPAIFGWKKPLKALLLSIAVLAAMVLVRYIMEFYVFVPYLKFDNYLGNKPDIGWYLQNCLLFSYKNCLFGLLAYFIVENQNLERKRKDIQQERVQSELSFLRSQINPHFLFNTLNDVYVLVYKKDDLAPEALLKLSTILRYMVHEGNHEKVLLSKELAYLNDYIDLQQIGSKNTLNLQVDIEGNPDNLLITPLLLIPFVENIFKHGILNDPACPAILSISIQDTQLDLRTRNAINIQQKDSVSGIGLHNVQRRLQLLYAGAHAFSTEQKNGIFYCGMQLNLTNKQ